MGKLSRVRRINKRITKFKNKKVQRSKHYKNKKSKKIKKRKRLKQDGGSSPYASSAQATSSARYDILMGPNGDPRPNELEVKQETGWDYEENLADGACFYWAALRGLNRLAATGEYTFPTKESYFGYLGEHAYLHGGPLGGGKMKDPPHTHFTIRYQDADVKKDIIIGLRKTLAKSNPLFVQKMDNRGKTHLEYGAWAENEQIQVFANYFGVCVAVWSFWREGNCYKTSRGDSGQDACALFGKDLCLREQTCSWTPGIRGTWSIFNPKSTSLTIDYDGGTVRYSDNFDTNIVGCKPIIYIYNSSEGGHYFLIEPKHLQQNFIAINRIGPKTEGGASATGSSSPSANAFLNQQKAAFQKLEQMKSNRIYAEQLQSMINT
jgi:hypothetical protein